MSTKVTGAGEAHTRLLEKVFWAVDRQVYQNLQQRLRNWEFIRVDSAVRQRVHRDLWTGIDYTTWVECERLISHGMNDLIVFSYATKI